MSEIEDTQKKIEELLARLLRGEPIKDANMSDDKAELLQELNKDPRVADTKEMLQFVQVLPDFFRQFKGELNLQEWVNFIINDLGPELEPLKDLQVVLDKYTDVRLDKTAERVIRLTRMGLAEETALKIVQGLAKDMAESFKKGSESATELNAKRKEKK